MGKRNPRSKTIQIPINHREFPPSYEESQRIKKLEDVFDSTWELGESPPETQNSPIAPSAPSASILTNADESTRNNENPVDVEVIIVETEFPVNGQPMPITVIQEENEDNLFCTPDDYTMKGWCMCFCSRCFMIFAHLCLFISLLPQKLKNCFHS